MMTPALEPWHADIAVVFNVAFDVIIGHVFLPLFPPAGRAARVVATRTGRALIAPFRWVTVRGSAHLDIQIGKSTANDPGYGRGRNATGVKKRRATPKD